MPKGRGRRFTISRGAGRFESVAQFLRSLPARAVNHKVVECLAKAGCFDAFGVTRKGLVDNLEQLMDMAAREREQRELGQGFLFDALPSEELERELASAGAAEDQERLAWEREVLGFYLTGHPLDRYRPQLQRFADSIVEELPGRVEDGWEKVMLGGLITGLKVIPIRKSGPNQGRRMASFHLEDPTGAVRVVVFPDAFDKVQDLLSGAAAVLVTATPKGEGGHVELTAEEIVPLEGIESRRASAIRIILDLDKVGERGLDDIRELLLAHPGDLPVRFELVRRGAFRARLVPPPALSVDPTPELKKGLADLLGGGRYELEFEKHPANGNGPRAARPAATGDPEPAEMVN